MQVKQDRMLVTNFALHLRAESESAMGEFENNGDMMCFRYKVGHLHFLISPLSHSTFGPGPGPSQSVLALFISPTIPHYTPLFLLPHSALTFIHNHPLTNQLTPLSMY